MQGTDWYYSSFVSLRYYYSNKRIFPDDRTTLWFCVVILYYSLIHYSSLDAELVLCCAIPRIIVQHGSSFHESNTDGPTR